MADVIKFRGKLNAPESGDNDPDDDWVNAAECLAEIQGAIARGEFDPRALVVGIIDANPDNSLVVRWQMSVTEIAMFFTTYIDTMRKAGIN